MTSIERKASIVLMCSWDAAWPLLEVQRMLKGNDFSSGKENVQVRQSSAATRTILQATISCFRRFFFPLFIHLIFLDTVISLFWILDVFEVSRLISPIVLRMRSKVNGRWLVAFLKSLSSKCFFSENVPYPKYYLGMCTLLPTASPATCELNRLLWRCLSGARSRHFIFAI